MNYFFDKWSPGIILGGHQEKTASHHMLQVTSAEGVGYTLVLNAIGDTTGLSMLGSLPCGMSLKLSCKVPDVLLLLVVFLRVIRYDVLGLVRTWSIGQTLHEECPCELATNPSTLNDKLVEPSRNEAAGIRPIHLIAHN